jgi:hypothetical protein
LVHLGLFGGGRGGLLGPEGAVGIEHFGELRGVGDETVGDLLHLLEGSLTFLCHLNVAIIMADIRLLALFGGRNGLLDMSVWLSLRTVFSIVI